MLSSFCELICSTARSCVAPFLSKNKKAVPVESLFKVVLMGSRALKGKKPDEPVQGAVVSPKSPKKKKVQSVTHNIDPKDENFSQKKIEKLFDRYKGTKSFCL